MLKFLQNILSKSKPYFEKGGKLESLYPIFEATDTILFVQTSVQNQDRIYAIVLILSV